MDQTQRWSGRPEAFGACGQCIGKQESCKISFSTCPKSQCTAGGRWRALCDGRRLGTLRICSRNPLHSNEISTFPAKSLKKQLRKYCTESKGSGYYTAS